MKMDFKIANIHCPACVKVSEMALKKLPGVTSVHVGSDGQSSIETDRDITQEEIANALLKAEKTAIF